MAQTLVSDLNGGAFNAHNLADKRSQRTHRAPELAAEGLGVPGTTIEVEVASETLVLADPSRVRQAVEKYDGEVVPANDPYGRPIYWLTVTQLEEHTDGTDLWAFQRGYITVEVRGVESRVAALGRKCPHDAARDGRGEPTGSR